MMKSGFTLCDDLMDLIGERVEKKREKDTMDYWCGRGDFHEFGKQRSDSMDFLAHCEVLSTLDELIECMDVGGNGTLIDTLRVRC